MAPVTGAREFGHGQPRAEPAAPRPAKGRSQGTSCGRAGGVVSGRPGGVRVGLVASTWDALHREGGRLAACRSRPGRGPAVEAAPFFARGWLAGILVALGRTQEASVLWRAIAPHVRELGPGRAQLRRREARVVPLAAGVAGGTGTAGDKPAGWPPVVRNDNVHERLLHVWSTPACGERRPRPAWAVLRQVCVLV